MHEDAHCIARYQLLEEFWRDRARVVLDPTVERLLVEGGLGIGHGSPPGVEQLMNALVPAAHTSTPIWMATTEESIDELAKSRTGARFIPRGALVRTMREEPWEVALIDLGAVLREDGSEPRDDVRDRFGRLGKALLTVLEEGLAAGRTVILMVPARDQPHSAGGLAYEELADLLAEYLRGGRIHGVFSPPMAAMVDFADPIEAAEDDVGAQTDEQTDDDVPLMYDNTVADEEPSFEYFLAIAGRRTPLADGMTLVELPPGEEDEVEQRGVRAQLAQARRHADEVVIQRQTLVDDVDRLQTENSKLQDEVQELRHRLAKAVSGGGGESVSPSSTDDSARADALRAQEQALRWRIEQLEAEVETLRRRPVEQLEAEVASLRARLAAEERPQSVASSPAKPQGAEPSSESASEAGAGATSGPGRIRGAAGVLERLVRRLERDERLGALELREKLLDLIRMLRSQPH